MADSIINFSNVGFRYDKDMELVLKDIDLEIKRGEFILITGESGSGKTTLANCINGLVPYFHEGELSGSVQIMGKDTRDLSISEIGEMVGSVFQDPRSQFFATNTTDEVAFGCLNMGLSREDVLRRIDGSFRQLNIDFLRNKSIFEISSGQKQMIAIASCHAMAPEIYLFDEPSANLDFGSTMLLAKTMEELKRAGKTVIVIEHRLYYVSRLFDRAVFVKDGRMSRILSNTQAMKLSAEELLEMGLRSFQLHGLKCRNKGHISKDAAIELIGVGFGYGRNRRHHRRRGNTQDLLKRIDLKATGGEIIGIVGMNGAGKTTLSKLCCGLLKENKGKILINDKEHKAKKRLGKIYFVMQDSDYQLFSDSVLHELKLGKEKEIPDDRCEEILTSLNLWEWRDAHPAALSRGQKQRLTIADAIAGSAEVIFFDEPTSGLDGRNMIKVSRRLRELAEAGKIIFVVTHDYELLIHACSRIVHLSDGVIAEDFQLTDDKLGRLENILRGKR